MKKNIDMMGKEIWKNVNGYEELYQVSSYGRVRSFDRITGARNNKTRITKGITLKNTKGKNGYYYVTLSKDKTYKKIYNHRLVAESFILNPSNKPTVNHKDGIKTNNYPDNLEWATYGENNLHAVEEGLCIKAKGEEKIKMSKLKNHEVEEIKIKISKGYSSVSLSKEYNVAPTTIGAIRQGKTWKHIQI